MDELLDNAPCGYLVFGDDGKIIDANSTLIELLGYERAELRELHIEKILSVAGRIFYQTHFFPLLKLHGKIEELYLDLRSKTGENIPVLINGSKRTADRGDFYDCIFVPIRKRNQYEEEIIKAKREAEAATLAKDEFLSVVSHELRTPLNAILGWARILQNDHTNEATVEKGLATISRNARIQTELIEDILDFTRIISGKMRLEVKRINLTEVIEAAFDAITPTANAKNIRIQKVLDSNCTIYGDADRLQQVLWNLLTNAVKFTPKGGRVQILMHRVNSSVEISISDTGQGISADFLPYIFERFQQQDKTKSRRNSGIGLGMAITYRIVELHAGTIRVESPGEGLGATFTVQLPVTIVHQTEAPASAVSAAGSSGEIKLQPQDSMRINNFHVLIVEDKTDARELLTHILTDHGVRVTAVETVSEAVEKFNLPDLDLVISDLQMPGEDGFSLIGKLNEFNRLQNKNIPAVALTAYTNKSERLKAIAAGYQIHIAKPVEPEELLAVITNFAKRNKVTS